MSYVAFRLAMILLIRASFNVSLIAMDKLVTK